MEISKTLYFEYLKERIGAQIFENETSFVIFKVCENHIFLLDCYSTESSRGEEIGIDTVLNKLFSLSEQLKLEIKAKIDTKDKFAERTMNAALKRGFIVLNECNGIRLIVRY